MKYVEKEARDRGGGWRSKVKLERKEREALGAVCWILEINTTQSISFCPRNSVCLNVRGHVRRVCMYVVVVVVVVVHNVALKRTRSNVSCVYIYIYLSRRNATRQDEKATESKWNAPPCFWLPVLAMRVNILKASRSVYRRYYGKRQANITPQIRFNATKRSK